MSSELTFAELGLSEPVLRALTELGYEKPTPIQAAAVGPLTEGRDILGQAQTGTGKTAAFALPLLGRVNAKLNKPQILVLAPTRELAVQVAEAFQSYAKHLPGFHVLPIYGGQSYTNQLRQLKRGPQVIVGTPGRVMDHMRRETLVLNDLQALVLDEADEMLKMGFIDDIEWILSHTPASRQLALFSATMPDAIRRVADHHLKNPEHISIKSATATVDRIDQSFVQVAQNQKLEALSRILEVEDTDGIIIFVRTRNSAEELAEKLEARGYASSGLHGEMSQQARERAVEALKKGKLDILIATDVAARGLDVERIGHVINYDIPYDTEAYVHRIGRTGRAGRNGKAILFVTSREMRMLRTIERATRGRIAKLDIPSSESVSERRVERLASQIQETLDKGGLDFMQATVAKLCNQLEVDSDALASALLQHVQQKRPLQISEMPKHERRERNERNDRNERGRDRDRGERGERNRRTRPAPSDFGKPDGLKGMPEVQLQRYLIDVGRSHGVQVGNIVGAIANEADIESRYIGQIEMYDDMTTVDLPVGMPNEVLSHLRKVWVCGQKLNIREAKPGAAREGNGGESAPAGQRRGGGRRDDRGGRDGRGGNRGGQRSQGHRKGGEGRGNGGERKRRPRNED
ncbi:DEAD/DEAH box helicase [Paraferrimonas sp. SM1919]|uniref:DEAD/DEAH box helicase n=1 Tax=Paraferrimonas sp. SM1919 TaxID=2662263 RepID=UPI0013D612D0|nr:DEAD/DEAH box helicase [Paraferrimonas sp. SM1919]